MINAVSSVSSLYAANATQQPPAQQKTQQSQQDSVQLSPAARAAAGDVDHDGDSH